MLPRSVALVTLGCTRNEVDSEELAGRLAAEGWLLVDDAADADVAVVNTCGFVEQAKKDSIDALLEASDLKEQPDAPRRSSRSAAWPSATASSSPPSCPRPTRCSASTPTRDMSSHLAPILDGARPRLARAVRPPPAAAAVARRAPAGRRSVALPGHGARRRTLRAPVPAACWRAGRRSR